MKIPNHKAREKVINRCEFTGSNLFGEIRGGMYVVYSYGEHWPLWVYDNDVRGWFGNSDKYSRSTTRHASQTQPCPGSEIKWLGSEEMLYLVRVGGALEYMKRRIGGIAA